MTLVQKRCKWPEKRLNLNTPTNLNFSTVKINSRPTSRLATYFITGLGGHLPSLSNTVRVTERLIAHVLTIELSGRMYIDRHEKSWNKSFLYLKWYYSFFNMSYSVGLTPKTWQLHLVCTFIIKNIMTHFFL